MKLKLTDKIKKFFGTRAVDGDEPYSGLQQLPQLDGHSPCTDGARISCFAPKVNSIALPPGSGSLSIPSVQHGAEKVHMPSTLSQKADLSSNPRTTGQDEAYCLQNEVYFPQLLLTLQTGTPEQKAVAAEALFNYTAESDAARQRATQAGVVAYLIDLLKAGTDHGKMYAAYTLSSLTSIEEALEQMCLLGAIPALISILSTCPLLVCKKGAMRALGRLARNDQAAADIVAANGLVPIISLLNRPDSSLVRRCLIALYFIGADKDALQQAIGAAGALPSLLSLARSDSPDVQAEATDVLKVLCRNVLCGRTLAELAGIEVLAGLVHTGLTSRTKASAARALQRLNDIPELKEQLAASSARDVLAEGSKCSSLLNTSAAATPFGQPGAALPHDAIGATVAGNPAAAPRSSTPPVAALVAGLDQLCLDKDNAAAAAAASAPSAQEGIARVHQGTTAAADDDAAVEVDDVKQLAEVLANPTNKRLREKAAAAIEQLAVDDPQACRELADMGALGSLSHMLAAGNSSVTRRAAARALGKLGDDAAMLKRMAEPAFITKLLQAAPELNGSALRAVLKLLQAMAADEHNRAAFPRHDCAAYLMQVLEGMQAGNTAVSNPGDDPAAGSEAAKGVGLAGTSSRGDLAAGLIDAHGVDVGAAVRVLDVLLALCKADPAVLSEVKQYPGGFRLLVSKLQQGPRALAPPVLQLLACLARSKAHQEDLLKGGVVPVLLGLYRSDDASIAMQAAKVMELLSEPAAQILERSLSKGDMGASTAAGSGPAGAEKPAAAHAASPFQAGSRLVPGDSSSGSHHSAQDGNTVVRGSSDQLIGGRSSLDRGRSTEAAQPSTSGQVAADPGPTSPGRCASPSRAAVMVVDGPGRPTARASSLANNGSTNALSRLNVGKSSKSFTAKPGQVAAESNCLIIGDTVASPSARSISPFGGQQQQLRQELAASKLPRRPATPEGGSSSKQEPGSPAAGASKPVVEAPASPSAAAAASNRAINKDRPQSAGVESPVRPGSAAKNKPASAARGSSAAAGSAQRQRLLAMKRPSSASLLKPASSPAPVVEPPSQPQQQQQQPAAGQAAEGMPRPPVLQMAAAFQAAAEAAAGGSAPSSPTQRPSLKQQLPPQQQQQPAGQASSSQRTPAVVRGTPVTHIREPAPAEVQGHVGAAAANAAVPAEAGSLAAAAPAPMADSSSKAQPDKVLPNVAAAGSAATAADADELLSSTYDNLHGLLMKKSDIEICRTGEGRKCRLGEGGFGVVYKAVMNGVDEVAVKLVKADSPSRKELELFLKEVQTLAKLHHRNIVQFYGACLETGSMFFVTELMKGGDLYTALRHHSETMKWERLGRKVALDVALGLNYLHAQRPPMMHRDLKSPNVLLSEEGVAKIADVGMVRSQVKDLVTAQPVMTPLWAAPEVVRHERASIKADIWSYGILIWELISGEDITEYQPLSISRQVGPSPNAKAMTLPVKCPAVARKLFTACTQMDPERRPGAQTLVEWLRADMAQNRF